MKKPKAIQIICIKRQQRENITKKIGVNSFEEGVKLMRKLKARNS